MILGSLVDLRPIRAADFVQLRIWESDPQIAAWLTTTATLLDARESADQEYDRLVRSPRVKILAIQTKEHRVVGFVRLNNIDLTDRKAELRIFIAPEQQQQGYGSDALRILITFCFHELGLHRVGLVVRVDNLQAIALYRRLGFRDEGKERDAAWSAGAWVALLHMGLLAHEWQEEQQ